MFKKILVPLDGSQVAESILPQVENLAKIHDAEIVLIRVAFSHALTNEKLADRELQAVTDAKVYLTGVEGRFQSAGIKVSSLTPCGHAAEKIVEHARISNCDLIVMSTHGRSGLGQFVLGSVAIKVLHVATVPVLLYRISK